MGAPEPHDFAVRDQRRSSVSAITSTAFRSTFVTTRTPLVSKRDAESRSHFLKKRKRNLCGRFADRRGAWTVNAGNMVDVCGGAASPVGWSVSGAVSAITPG